MKSAAYALAAVLAFSGAAFASETGAPESKPSNIIEILFSSEHNATATNTSDRQANPSTDSQPASRLGVDINPSSVLPLIK